MRPGHADRLWGLGAGLLLLAVTLVPALMMGPADLVAFLQELARAPAPGERAAGWFIVAFVVAAALAGVVLTAKAAASLATLTKPPRK